MHIHIMEGTELEKYQKEVWMRSQIEGHDIQREAGIKVFNRH